MATVMKASDFVEKLKDIAKNYKTLYVMGCFGAPMNDANKKRYTSNHSYNKQASRTKMINAASSDTFGFDCGGLIKGVLWGWNGDKTKTYGGAKYATNGINDVGADSMIKLCSGVTTDFSKIEVGEAVWCEGHIGVYIGDGLAVECTPSWDNDVQITAVRNIGAKNGYNARTWTKHGKLPYIDYTASKAENSDKTDNSLSGIYEVVSASGLNVRAGAGTSNKSLGVLKNGTLVRNKGVYRTDKDGNKWLHVAVYDGFAGYCSAKYLKKC